MKQETKERRQTLVGLGLSEKEAVIYEMLLRLGEMQARQIEVKTGFKKNTYLLLKSLQKRGLVVKKEQEKRIFYLPGSPENLRILMEEQRRGVKRVEAALEQVLPELKGDYVNAVGRPVVRYVQGAEGLKSVYEEVYAKGIKESFGCLDLEAVEKAIPTKMQGELIPSRVKEEHRAYAVLTDNEEGRRVALRDKQEMRESVLIDEKKYPLPAEVSVYGKKIAMLSFSKGDMVGLLIENEDLAKSLESVYRYLFSLKRENERLLELVGEITREERG